MHANVFLQLRTALLHAQRVHQRAVKARHRSHFKAHAHVDQRYFGGLGVFAKQLKVNVRGPGRGATPDRPTDVGLEALQSHHPLQGQFAQGMQLLRLGVGAEQRNVFLDRRFNFLVVGQAPAPARAELFDGAALGCAIVQPFFHNESGCSCRYLSLVTFHGRIVPACLISRAEVGG